MSDIPVELNLDVTSALAAVASVEQALVAAGDAFQQSVNAALGSIDAAPTTIPIEVDAGSVTDSIDSAVQAADATVPVTADASSVGSDIDAAVASSNTDVTVGVQADTSAAQAAISELEATPVEVGVEADTSSAQQSLDQLGSSSESASEGLGKVEGATKGAEAGASALEGSLLGSTKALAAIGPEGAAAAAAIGVVTAAGKTLVEAGIEAESALQRFNLVLGVSAARVRIIDVGGLNEDLGKLANRLGASDESLLNATARFFNFGIANGTARSQVEESVKQIDALAAHAVALNPALGDVGDTVNRLTQALATGRNTADFGVSLQRSAVVAEALRENVTKTTETLTRYDLAAAGAKLATDQLGDSLATGINAGAQNVAIQFRAVREEFRNTLEEAGTKLTGPALELIQALEPAAAPVAAAFGAILQAVVPLATALTNVLVPVLERLKPLFDFLARAETDLGLTAEKAAAKHDGFGDSVKSFVGKVLTSTPGLTLLDKLLGTSGDAAEEAAGQIESAFAGLGGSIAAGLGGAQNAVASFVTGISSSSEARDALTSKFQAGLPAIGDAFTVEAGRVATATKSIDKSSQQLIDAATKLEGQFAAGLPSISDAFKEGVSPEDLAKAKETVEGFIQGVEGVGKSAADAAQAVIDKAQAEGGTGLAGFLQQLREQTAQIAAFQGSIATLKSRGALDLAGAFADQGIQAAADAAEAAGLTDADLAAAEQTVEQAKTVKQGAVASLGLFADQLVATFGPKGAEAGATFGQGLVDNLASPDIIAKARAESAKLAEAAATPQGGGGGGPAPEQSLSGFLAGLKSQSGDIQKFQENLDTIARNGGQVLSDTLREQGITAATAAAQAAALAPAQLVSAEQAVRDAQAVLAAAEEDNKAAAARLQQFMADSAAHASAGFTDAFIVDIGPTLGAVAGQITAATPPIVLASSTLGAAAGAALGASLTGAVAAALGGGALAGIFLGGSANLSAVTLPPITLAGASFGTPTNPAVTGASQPTVNVENINVTPPKDSTADEQAAAIARQLAYAVQGAR